MKIYTDGYLVFWHETEDAGMSESLYESSKRLIRKYGLFRTKEFFRQMESGKSVWLSMDIYQYQAHWITLERCL